MTPECLRSPETPQTVTPPTSYENVYLDAGGRQRAPLLGADGRDAVPAAEGTGDGNNQVLPDRRKG